MTPPTAPSLTDAAAIVEDFLTALARDDVAHATELLHRDVAWINVGYPTIRGRGAVAGALRLLERPVFGFDVRIDNLAANDDTVLTERVDELRVGRLHWRFAVCGTFEIGDGAVILWRDHFDHADVIVGLVRALAGLVVPALRRPLSH